MQSGAMENTVTTSSGIYLLNPVLKEMTDKSDNSTTMQYYLPASNKIWPEMNSNDMLKHYSRMSSRIRHINL